MKARIDFGAINAVALPALPTLLWQRPLPTKPFPSGVKMIHTADGAPFNDPLPWVSP